MTFQVPPVVNLESLDGNVNEASLDEANWYFYRYVNDQCPAWPGLLGTTNREKSKLVAIINDVSTMMYAQHSPQISAKHVLKLYFRFISWRDELPEVIGKIESNNSQALPHILSLLQVPFFVHIVFTTDDAVSCFLTR